MLPTGGYLVRAASELAGLGPLGGDVTFLKSELELSAITPLALPRSLLSRHQRRLAPQPQPPLPSRTTLSAGLRLGLLCPLPFTRRAAGPSHLSDRFTLGGPTDVRGFKLGGIGPHDGPDSVGGDLFAAGSLNLLLPLPRTADTSPLRLQLFAGAGRCVALHHPGDPGTPASPRAVATGLRTALDDLTTGLPSVAAGVGLVYAHPVARFEINFGLPLAVRRGEEGRKGLQVGVGINFM